MNIDLDYNIGDKVYKLHETTIREYTINALKIDVYSNGKTLVRYQVFGYGIQAFYSADEMNSRYYRSKNEILKKIADQL